LEIETPSCLGLDDRADEVGERLDVGSRDHVAQRVSPGLADANLGQRPAELVGQRAGQLLDHLGQRGVEAEAGANGDRQQVQRVRDHLEDELLAGLDPAAQPELRQQVADAEADHAEEHPATMPRREAEDQEHDHAGRRCRRAS
jgi:glutamate synthase domain-containing protein 1